MKTIKEFFETLALLIGATTTRDDAVAAGICDYSGQGRNNYGK